MSLRRVPSRLPPLAPKIRANSMSESAKIHPSNGSIPSAPSKPLEPSQDSHHLASAAYYNPALCGDLDQNAEEAREKTTKVPLDSVPQSQVIFIPRNFGLKFVSDESSLFSLFRNRAGGP